MSRTSKEQSSTPREGREAGPETGLESRERTTTADAAPADPDAADGPGPAEPADAVEPDAGAGAEPAAKAAPGDLEQRLAEAERKAADHWDALLRSRAELENLRKRAERDLEHAHKFALERFVSELLPVKDSLELGLSAASEEGADAASVREGVELTLKMFRSTLEKFGVDELCPDGQTFDPQYHEAMSTQEAESVDSGTVLNVIQKGYVLNGRLVRPAMVIVAR